MWAGCAALASALLAAIGYTWCWQASVGLWRQRANCWPVRWRQAASALALRGSGWARPAFGSANSCQRDAATRRAGF